MKTVCLLLAFVLAGIALPVRGAPPVDTKKLPLPLARKVDFVKEVYPLFVDKCVSCHGPKKAKGKYRIDTKEGAFKIVDDGPYIIAGNSEKSPLIHLVAGLVEDTLMPPPSDKPGESEPLTKEQISLLRAWIDQGAEWPDGEISVTAKAVTFAQDIAPVLQAACTSCHGEAKQEGGFRADSLEAVLKGGKGYGAAVKAGDLKSPLAIIVAGLDGDLPLPEKHKLPAKQLDLVKKWIEQGAK